MKDLHCVEFSHDGQFLFKKRSSSFKIKGEKYRCEKCNNIFYKHFSPATKDATYDLDVYGEDPGQFFSLEQDIEDSDEDEQDRNVVKKWNKNLKEDRATAVANVPLFEEEDSYSDDFDDSDLSSNENWQRLLMMEETFEMEIDADDNQPRPGSSSAP